MNINYMLFGGTLMLAGIAADARAGVQYLEQSGPGAAGAYASSAGAYAAYGYGAFVGGGADFNISDSTAPGYGYVYGYNAASVSRSSAGFRTEVSWEGGGA